MWNNVGFPYQDGMCAIKIPVGDDAYEIKIVGRKEDLEDFKDEEGAEIFVLTNVCWKPLPKKRSSQALNRNVACRDPCGSDVRVPVRYGFSPGKEVPTRPTSSCRIDPSARRR